MDWANLIISRLTTRQQKQQNNKIAKQNVQFYLLYNMYIGLDSGNIPYQEICKLPDTFGNHDNPDSAIYIPLFHVLEVK